MMKLKKNNSLFHVLLLVGLTITTAVFSLESPALTPTGFAQSNTKSTMPARRAPFLGTDTVWADGPHILIEAWQDKATGDALADILQRAGVRSLRFNFAGIYSPQGAEATARVKAENKTKNEFPWFPFGDFTSFMSAHDLTAVVGINVEEGPEVAEQVIRNFLAKNPKAKLTAVELSNEPWLNHRPWMPEDYATRAAEVIERLTPLGVRFALPLTVGDSRNTPTKLSDTEWNTRMMRSLSSRVDIKNRPDIYGVLHLYAGGVRAKSIDIFNKIVRPFAPRMRYLVTEFNIRLSLDGNPHLTNKYALEFARKLAELMNVPDIEALYTHAIPYHSIMYWTNSRRITTVIGQRDEKLQGEAMTRGWHLTPAGKVYALYSNLAWNGDIVFYKEADKQRFWAVRNDKGGLVVTVFNEDNKPVKKKITVAGTEMNLNSSAQSITCFDERGRVIETLTLPF
jgi:hypothetical protein